jgi:phospholipid/cholesterol/gamma-HCH transport system substrate-binding protein
MRFSPDALRLWRTATVFAFIAMLALIFGVLWVNSGGQLPGITGGYHVRAAFSDVHNLVYDSDIRMAGVQVGKVRDLVHKDGEVEVTMEIRGAAEPLHEGATVKLRPRTLIEETYIEVVDGDGAPIPHGGRLPATAEVPSVRIDDVLNALDRPTREAVASLVRRLEVATEGRSDDLSATLSALGRLGREGHDAIDVLAAQTEDLKGLLAETTTLLSVLDEGEGQIARLASATERVTRVSAERAGRIEETMRLLPGLLDRTRAAAPSLGRLSGALSPLAEPLRRAAPGLQAALAELPGATAELRGLLPPLDTALARAPATLTRTPPVAADLSALVPPLRTLLADVNPMLAYLAPYGQDLAGFVANVAQVLNGVDPGGKYLRILVVLNEKSFTGDVPVSTQAGPLEKSNAYPDPGQGADPQPFSGNVPRVEEEP